MAVSTATVFFVLFAMPVTSSSSDDHGELDVDSREHRNLHAFEGVSLIQSGKTIIGGVPNLANDPFGDLDDDFDIGTVKAPIATTGATLRMQDLIDTNYWSAFGLDLIMFAAVVGIGQFLYFGRQSFKKGLKAKATAANSRLSSSSHKSSGGKKAVDFGPLLKAAKSGDEACWRSLLEEFPDITSAQDFCGCTALHVAAHAGSVAMTQELIARGAEVNAPEAWEETPLHVAARQGAVGVCKLLLEHGAEINSVDSSERTPLLSAGHAGKEGTCALLLENGGQCGGVADDEMPAMLNALLLARIMAPQVKL